MSLTRYELGLKIDTSKGQAYLNRMYYRSFTLNIFIGNAEAIKILLIDNSDPGEHIKLIKDKSHDGELIVFREVARSFHNFLAGAMTLVDHTRVFMEEFYLGTEVNRRYKNIVQREFADNPLTSFVQDLRNYMMHRGMPPIKRTLSFTKLSDEESGQQEVSTRFSLGIDDLRKWKNWRTNSRKYMDIYNQSILLQPLVDSYYDSITRFHNGLNEIMDEYHSGDMEELYNLRLAFTQQYILEGGIMPNK